MSLQVAQSPETQTLQPDTRHDVHPKLRDPFPAGLVFMSKAFFVSFRIVFEGTVGLNNRRHHGPIFQQVVWYDIILSNTSQNNAGNI